MMMSPGSMNSSSLSMVESTGAPACTNMITRLCVRGGGGQGRAHNHFSAMHVSCTHRLA
jgi:hypothetical protein